jgi:hypothetical protein
MSVMDVRDRAGGASVVLGVVGLVGLAVTWVLSTTDVVDPPNAVRIPFILLLPVGLFGALLAGLLGLRGGRRPLALTGLALSAATLAAFVVLLNVAG